MSASTRRFATHHLPALLWAGLILVALSLPSALVGPLADRLPLGSLPVDKVVHGLLFLVMAVLAERSLRTHPRLRRTVLLAFLTASAYGAATEILQARFTDRTAEIGDFVADVVGAAGVVILLVARPGARAEGPARGSTAGADAA